MSVTDGELDVIARQAGLDQDAVRSIRWLAPQTEAEAHDLAEKHRRNQARTSGRQPRQRQRRSQPAAGGGGRSRATTSPPTNPGGPPVKRTTVAKIAQDVGLDAAAASALVNMNPTSEAEARELAGLFAPNPKTVERIKAAPGPPRSPGEQFVASPDYRELQRNSSSGASRPFERGLGVTLEGVTLRAQATGSENYFPRQRDRRRVVSIEPTSARVPALVNVVDDVEAGIVQPVHEQSRTTAGGGVPPGAELPEAGLDLVGDDLEMIRWGARANVSLDALRDPGNAREVFDRFTLDVSMRALEDDMLNGDGSETSTTKRLTGVTQTTGVATITRDTANGETRLSALVRAGVAVLDSEYTPPLAAVVNPNDLEALINDVDSNGAYQRIAETLELAGIDRLVATSRIAAGTAVVGAWRQAATLFQKGPFQLLVWNQHLDFAARRLVMLEMSTDAQFDVVASGFRIVDL